MAMNSLEQQGFRASVRCTVPDLVADIEVAPGDTLGIIGPNGAGKSTLLSIVAGLRRTPDSRVAVGSRILQGDRTFVEPHRRSVVLLEQKARLFGHLSVRRNVEFGPAAAGLSRKDIRNRAQRWLDAVGVADLADRMPSGLSGGQAQRVAIARALATEPEVLLLDEPFAALDALTRETLQEDLRAVSADLGRTNVFVTHSADEAAFLGSRIVVLTARPGRVALDITSPIPRLGVSPEEIRDSPEYTVLRAQVAAAVKEAAVAGAAPA